MIKRLIVCCDGTWQDLDQPYPTNVVKMVQAVKPVDDNGIHQIVYYDSGVGTKQFNSGNSSVSWYINELIKIFGGAFGAGIDQKIQAAYGFLCLNYEPGDEIYLFGFSRGSYTVRCLAGLIYNSSLLHRKSIRKVSEAYELYRNRNKKASPKGEDAIAFRGKYGREVPIKALCCWDTVASLGLPDLIPWLPFDQKFNERYSFYDSTINSTIEKGFHAVAIDEIRKTFDVTQMEPSKPNQVTQVWFPGGHGCVGGGLKKESGLSDGALKWMMDQVKPLGLALDETQVEYDIQPDETITFDNKPKPPFDAGGINIREVKGTFSDLHESVKKRWKKREDYRPENLQKFKTELDSYN